MARLEHIPHHQKTSREIEAELLRAPPQKAPLLHNLQGFLSPGVKGADIAGRSAVP